MYSNDLICEVTLAYSKVKNYPKIEEIFGLPAMTVWRFVNKKPKNKNGKVGRPRILTSKEKTKIKKVVSECSALQRRRTSTYLQTVCADSCVKENDQARATAYGLYVW